MQFQVGITSNNVSPTATVNFTGPDAVPALLAQLVELQREQFRQMLDIQMAQLHHARATSHDHLARLRNLLNRWEKDHPDIARNAVSAYPQVEKTYVELLSQLMQELVEQDEESLESEYVVQELLDRFGSKLGQLGQLLNILGPLSEAAQQNEAARHQSS